jgi:Protein of unknown function (DUF1239).
MLLLFISCGRKKEAVGEAITERDSLPMMTTLGVETYVSDSGVVRYKILADRWDVYDRKIPSYWAFEEGAYLEQFDTLFNVQQKVKADTAYYYDKKKIWELRGNVHVENINGDIYDTELLFWDQAAEKIYSDKFVRIQQTDRTITGYGFDSNQQMTNPRIRNMAGIFYVEENQPSVPPEELRQEETSEQTDSIN